MSRDFYDDSYEEYDDYECESSVSATMMAAMSGRKKTPGMP